jgi:hypothetical protein
MDFNPPKITTAGFGLLLMKLIVFIGVFFLFAKLYYEAKQLALLPESIITLLFVLSCLATTWFYRINFRYMYPAHNVLAKTGFNIFGFVFVKVQLNGKWITRIRLWNASIFSHQITDIMALEFKFKPCDEAPKGGCRLIIKEKPEADS